MEQTVQKKSLFNRFLDFVERVGNKMPQPLTMFGIFAVVILILSVVGSAMGWSATGEMLDSATGQVTMQTVTMQNLLTRDGIIYIINNVQSLYINYAPLGVLLVIFFGIGLADGSGYLTILIKKLISVTPRQLIVPVIMIIGVCGNLASTAGVFFMMPMVAIIFLAYGRHPIAGMFAVNCAITAGFSANLLVTDVDAVLSSLTQQAAQLLDPNYEVNPLCNYYFMVASTFFLALVGWFICEKVIEPRLGKYDPSNGTEEALMNMDVTAISAQEKKALRVANLVLLAMIIGLVLLALPQDSILRNPTTGSLISGSVLMKNIITFLSVLFFVPSFVYGKMTGVFKTDKDVCNALYKQFSTTVPLFVTALTASHFLNWFSRSNLANIISLSGANLLRSINANKYVLILCFIVIVAFVNIFTQSYTAKWVLFAPIFVPMMMKLGWSPELTQLIYRIGDSCTNCMTPMTSALPWIIMLMQKYDKNAGMGNYFSMTMPYAFGFLCTWPIFVIIWLMLGLPIGVAAPTAYIFGA